MPADVIDRVHALAQCYKANSGLEFGNQNGQAPEAEEEEGEYDSDADSTFYPDTDTSSTQSEQEIHDDFDYEDNNNAVAIPGRNNPWREEEKEKK